jgi:osmoprotectant transport system ATP-binding protein
MERAPANGPVIDFRGVAYTLPNGRPLLHDLNLQVQPGETLILLGRSGSGKTTTLKLVNRLLTPSAGEIRVNGALAAESDVIRLRRGIGYVIQDVGLFPHLTVERNIGLLPRIEGWPAERIRSRVEELLQLVGLDPQIASRYPHQLSGGQRQRVGVARALAATIYAKHCVWGRGSRSWRLAAWLPFFPRRISCSPKIHSLPPICKLSEADWTRW